MAQGAIQGATYAADIIKHHLAGQDDPANREPFKYWDKGSMATVSRFDAVAQVPVPLTKKKLEFAGPLAWLSWLVLHLVYLVGYKNRVTTLFTWFVTFLGRGRAQMAITSQMIYARTSMQLLQNQLNALAAADKVEKNESA
jgi:NADH dehydrogenase